MGIESFLQALGFGELALNPAFVAQVGVLGVTALTFLASLALAVISFRSAAVAHYAKADAEAELGAARALAAEVRSLTAQVEKRAMALNAPELRVAHAAHDDHHDDHHAGHAAHDHDDRHADHGASHGGDHHDDHHDDHHAGHAADDHGHGGAHADHAGEAHAAEADVHHISPVIAARNKARHSHAHDGDHSHRAEADAHERSLYAATKAATVPFALLRRRSR